MSGLMYIAYDHTIMTEPKDTANDVSLHARPHDFGVKPMSRNAMMHAMTESPVNCS